jgi:hypothetical protein
MRGVSKQIIILRKYGITSGLKHILLHDLKDSYDRISRKNLKNHEQDF